MLNKKEKSTQSNFAVLNVVGEGTTVEGDIISNGDLRIDGIVVGNIVTQAKCVIGATAKVSGNVEAKNCDISGKMEGDVKVGEVLLLKSTGIIQGDVRSSKLVVEIGGELNGSCTMGSSVSMIKNSEKNEDNVQSNTAG